RKIGSHRQHRRAGPGDEDEVRGVDADVDGQSANVRCGDECDPDPEALVHRQVGERTPVICAEELDRLDDDFAGACLCSDWIGGAPRRRRSLRRTMMEPVTYYGCVAVELDSTMVQQD